MRQLLLLAAIGALLLARSAQASPQGTKGAPEATAEQASSERYERIGRFIYAFHRAGVSVDKLTDPVLARRAPPELAQRAGALAEKFDQVVKQPAPVPDEELHAMLREAHEVGAAIHQWRQSQLR